MNEYHLISSHDHFRWKSAGNSIITCTRKLKSIDTPLLKYGKISGLTDLSLIRSDMTSIYPVVCQNVINRNALDHYSLKMTATLHGKIWHTSSDMWMHGKHRLSMESTNCAILNLMPDKLQMLKDAASPSPVIIKVQCYRDLMTFTDPTVTGVCYEAYIPEKYSLFVVYGKSMPELSISIFDKMTIDRIDSGFGGDFKVFVKFIMTYLRRELAMLRCFASEMKVKTAGDVMDMYDGENAHSHIEFMYVHMHLCLLTLLYEFIVGAIWPRIMTVFCIKTKRNKNLGRQTDMEKLSNKMMDYLQFLSVSKNEILAAKANPMLLAETIIKLANMPISRAEMKLIINETMNCMRMLKIQISRDDFDEAMKDTINYKQLSTAYQYFTSTHAAHCKSMTYMSAKTHNNVFISSMTQTRYLQASHRSSSHKPPDASIRYKAFSIRLLAKHATVEVYCIHTHKLLHIKHFASHITTVAISHATHDWWLATATIDGRRAACLISLADVCSDMSSIVSVDVVEFTSGMAAYRHVYAASQGKLYRLLILYMPMRISINCIRINIDDGNKISHLNLQDSEIFLSKIIDTCNTSSTRHISSNSQYSIINTCAHSDCLMLSLKSCDGPIELLVGLRLNDKGDTESTAFESFTIANHHHFYLNMFRSSHRIYAVAVTSGPVCSLQVIVYRNDRLIKINGSMSICDDLKMARKKGYSIRQVTQMSRNRAGFEIWMSSKYRKDGYTISACIYKLKF